MTRRRSWSPPARSAHVLSAAPSLAQSLPADARQEDVWRLAETTWRAWPASDHLAVRKPTCTVPRCTENAATWSRCRQKPCRQIIARCPTHNPTDPMLRARDAHEATHG